jgi:hypothetical protein
VPTLIHINRGGPATIYARLPRPNPAADRSVEPATIGRIGALGGGPGRRFTPDRSGFQTRRRNSRRREPAIRDSLNVRYPETSRQSGIAKAIVRRSAGAIQPSFSPQSTRWGCLISGIRRSSSRLSRSRFKLKGVPSQMPSETPKGPANDCRWLSMNTTTQPARRVCSCDGVFAERWSFHHRLDR